ncbi:hypothetical protein EJB05_31315, partial [Eragrostis curvula]
MNGAAEGADAKGIGDEYCRTSIGKGVGAAEGLRAAIAKVVSAAEILRAAITKVGTKVNNLAVLECLYFNASIIISCKRLVVEYIPLILVKGQKFLETTDVCSAIHACKTGTQTSMGSVLSASS